MRLSLHIICLLLFLGMTSPANADPQDIPVDTEERTKIIERIAKRLNKGYVFPDVAKEMADALEAKCAQGGYDEITSLSLFCEVLTKDLRAVSHDKHIRVRVTDRSNENSDRDPDSADTFDPRRYENYGFERVLLCRPPVHPVHAVHAVHVVHPSMSSMPSVPSMSSNPSMSSTLSTRSS